MECVFCEKSIERHRAERANKYCTDTCRKKAAKHRRDNTIFTEQCVGCGKTFSYKRKNDLNGFCSHKCRKQTRRRY